MYSSRLEPQKVISHIPIMPYHEVADIGAGEGRVAIPMAKFLHDGKVVEHWGVTDTGAMMEQLKG